MATVEENRRFWEEVYPWPEHGEEWSRGWGGTENLWKYSLLPRLEAYLPANRILELATGHGRFTPYLSPLCQNYLGIDLAPHCVEICRERFPGLRFEVNDGQTLPMAEDGSVDLLFSFFSLIHADIPTLRSYLREFSRILSSEGVAFIHHSNLAAHSGYFQRVGRLPKRVQTWLFDLGLIDLPQWREPTVSASVVKELAAETGLRVLRQETVNFGSRKTIDAFTLLARNDGRWKDAPYQLAENPGLMHEAMRVRLGR